MTSLTANETTSPDLSAAEPLPVSYLRDCLAILLDSGRELEHRPLIRLLQESGDLLALIGDDHQLQIAEAVSIAQMAVEDYPDFGEKLLAMVEAARADSPESVARALRALQVLEFVCEREHLVLRLLEIKHAEPRVRSKVTLTVGRLTQSPKWLLNRLKDHDPRARANAVEGMWGADAEGLGEAFLEASREPHHRIAANAALGLYRLGEASAVPVLYSMLRHDEELFRRAALWAVGRVADTRYIATVEAIAKRAESAERVTAEQVMAVLANRHEMAEFRSPLSLKVTHRSTGSDGRTIVTLRCVSYPLNRWLSPPDVAAVDFTIWQGSEQIERYAFRPVGSRGSLAAVVVIPSLSGGLGEVLRAAWRDPRDSEKIAIVPYRAADPTDRAAPADFGEVRFIHDMGLLGSQMPDLGSAKRTLNGALEAGLRTLMGENGEKVLFVLAEPGETEGVSPLVSALAARAGVTVHSIVSNRLTDGVISSFRYLAALTGGRMAAAGTADRLRQEILSARADCFGMLELSWMHNASVSSEARIVCTSSYGFGVAVV